MSAMRSVVVGLEGLLRGVFASMAQGWRAVLVMVLALLSVLALGGCAARSGASGAAADSASGEAASSRPLGLWKVSRDGVEPSWLFGTCHLGVRAEEALPLNYRKQLETASLYVMEVDPATMVPSKVQEMLMLEGEQRIPDLMGAEVWDQVVEKLALGPAAAIFETMHPFALMGYIVGQMANEIGGAEQGEITPMDLALAALATKHGVKQAYLETVEEQMNLFLGFPMDKWMDGIKALLEPGGRDELKTELKAALSVCHDGDLDKLNDLLASESAEDPDWMAALLPIRNKNWMPHLDGWFQEGNAFVAVGAGHMVGEEGLVSLLTAKGWTVEQQEGVTEPWPEDVAADATMLQGVSRQEFMDQIHQMGTPFLCSESQVLVACLGESSVECESKLNLAFDTCADEIELPDLILSSDSEPWGEKMAACALGKVGSDAVIDPANRDACEAIMQGGR